MTELQIMIILIEGEYQIHERNTAEKMSKLIKKEFDKVVSENEINHFYGLTEDYERINRAIEHGHYYY